MVFIPPGLLTDLRAATTSSLPDVGTIARTGAIVPCRVHRDTLRSEFHLDGWPHILPMHRWGITLPDGTDVKAFDVITITGKATYVVLLSDAPSSYSVSNTVHCLIATLSATGSTKRESGALAIGATGGTTANLSNLLIWSIAGVTMNPISPHYMADTFGVTVAAAAKVYVGWPVGNTADLPIRPKDTLVLPSGQYAVHGVECYAGSMIVAYVEIPST